MLDRVSPKQQRIVETIAQNMKIYNRIIPKLDEKERNSKRKS